MSMYNNLKNGGLLLFTCATIGRPIHDPYQGKYVLPVKFPKHYKPLTEKDIRSVYKLDDMFKEYEFELNNIKKDLYFTGIKR